MKRICLFALLALVAGALFAQQPLPGNTYKALRDSSDAIEIILMQGDGGSISLDGDGVRYMGSFFENKTAEKFSTPIAGTIMWLTRGRELITGQYYLGETSGYVVFKTGSNEYVNIINQQGVTFFKTQFK